jgi:uncharacterized protein (TIGR02118 family)
MICVAVMYPNATDVKFDIDYYRDQHLTLVRDCYGPFGLSGLEMDEALSKQGKNASPYLAIAYMLFSSIDEFMRAYKEVGKKVMGDISNFTDIEPTIQISHRVSI